ncbi:MULTISPECIES: NUDIX hydrolase [Amycolatopsis]|uniref:NUDIX domain-containing protein n=1 Tax=Amycolatopsis thermalba TaxID=944492 RepID=A0ABY4NRK1_9PSEU|nr:MULTISPECIES: NUDIX domain-containing protein [Amycolatopsis]OXM68346.1 NUDIX hydrolase [Amycolatopsis sp. KNN50.9b]UQS22678.1 NUDIX domain-containing protein [Amycolatopsis thermalba]
MSGIRPVSVRCVGGILHDHEGRLLLVQRANEPGRGLWSIPGGRVEPGETDSEALVREMREETGLVVRPGALAGHVVRGRYEIYDYVCQVESGFLQAGDDAADVRWVDEATFTALALTDGLADTLRGWEMLPRC